jgi:uncharacterized membrane protein YkvA (DUF1232 family)
VSEKAKHSPELDMGPDTGFGLEPLPTSSALVPYAVRVNASLVRRGFWPKIRRVAARVPFAEDAVALWYCALDRETPASTKALLLAALAWFVLPKPFRPRRLPIPGLLIADEAAVIAAALALARRAVQPRHRERARAVLARMARS